MLWRMLTICVTIAVFMVVPALGKPSGCKKVDFFGSYTRAELNQDVFGDGSAIHSFVYQLNIHSDGTATQYWTGSKDYFTALGTGSAYRGSWTCRNDGKLIVTLINANYFPVTNNPNVTGPDVELRQTFRTTYLFSVDDENTLTTVQARTRTYLPNQDPTDPNGGTLGTLSRKPLTYSRLIASDADLLIP